MSILLEPFYGLEVSQYSLIIKKMSIVFLQLSTTICILSYCAHSKGMLSKLVLPCLFFAEITFPTAAKIARH